MDKLQLYTKEREADTEKCKALFAQFDADNSGRLERSAHSNHPAPPEPHFLLPSQSFLPPPSLRRLCMRAYVCVA